MWWDYRPPKKRRGSVINAEENNNEYAFLAGANNTANFAYAC